MNATMLDIFDQIWERKNAFLAVFFVLFCLSYGLMVAIDFVPEAPTEKLDGSAAGAASSTDAVSTNATKIVAKAEVVAPAVPVVAQYPVRIKIEKLGTDVPILNPSDTSIESLDANLLKGVVRYPTSADFARSGTMLLFGHSSYLPTVLNQNFKAFNGIQKLSIGDEIRIESSDTVYVYKVTKVYKAVASEASVSLSHKTDGLILVTCNSFGSKDDRYVVDADLFKKVPV